MKPIQLVDLHTQYLKMKDEIDQAILNVLDSTAFINGSEVKKFQTELEEYLDVKHVIPCANGTDALQIALMAIGAKPGDEVITPSFTYVATAEVIALLQLTPVFVEVDKDTFTIDPSDVKSKITSRTKAIVPVHLYGQCAPMKEILQIARERGLFVIEDTAQALGSHYIWEDGRRQQAGTMGNIGTTSFFPSKNLGCYGDGGALMTNDDALAAKVRMMANHGQSVRYHHDDIGVNSRLDTIQAAILSVKLKHFDTYLEARQKAADFYNGAFSELEGVQVPTIAPYSTHGYHQYTLKLDGSIDRDALQGFLQDRKIPANVYYPIPVHLQKGYKQYNYDKGDLPLTEELCKRVISLPMHTELGQDQLEYITDSVKKFITK